MKNKEEREGISQSFVMGVIALVFLIIGYQTALFIHHASVMKITANRDAPDTVYVYPAADDSGLQDISHSDRADAGHSSSSSTSRRHAGRPSSGNQSDSKLSSNRLEHHPSKHSARAEAVRRNYPRKNVESFRFDPNSVSVDDLCRLGFTPKQAQAIDNYRRKGGRFRRKTDFAASFVVSDSIYARLEPYIDIPLLDLNRADSAAFDALPGIGGWFASEMIRYRKALGSYSYKEQLMDIRNFSQEKYEALVDLITVSQENVVPYPLWTLPADSLRLHPYIGDHAARAIVLYRTHNPQSEWSVDALIKAGIIHPERAPKLRLIPIAAP
jgi:DNA uptake protein ComE-like DNA-binding protein